MSEESTTPDLVELTRSRVDAAGSGDIDAMTSFLAQHAVWDSSPMGLEVYEGRAAIHSGLEDWWGSFDVSGAEAEEILDLGNGVTFAVVTLTGRPSGGSGEVQLRYAAVSTWGQGVIVRETNYTDIDEARADAERLAESRGEAMSQSVEVVKRFYELWNARDADAIGALLDPHAVAYMPDGWPEPGPFHGHEAIVAQVRTVMEDFGELTILLETIAAHDDWVLTRHHTLAQGEHSGLEAEFRNSVAFRLRAGKIVEAHFCWDHADALKAAGLAAQAMSENLDLVRSIYADWERGDFSSVEWADPGIELVIADGPEPGVWTGLAGLLEGTRGLLDTLADYRVEADDYRELDCERVLVLMRHGGRGKASGLAVGQLTTEGANVLHVRDGNVARLVLYWDRDRALADLGLAPEGGIQ